MIEKLYLIICIVCLCVGICFHIVETLLYIVGYRKSHPRIKNVKKDLHLKVEKILYVATFFDANNKEILTVRFDSLKELKRYVKKECYKSKTDIEIVSYKYDKVPVVE